MEWRDTEYTGYSVSNAGDVKGPKGYILKPQMRNGYHYINIRVGEEQKHIRIHRLVAIAFIPNPENKETVNHKDWNTINNSVGNLEWASREEQVIHRRAYGVTGFKNIDRIPGGYWRVKIRRQGHYIFTKTYATPEEAIIARDNFLNTV